MRIFCIIFFLSLTLISFAENEHNQSYKIEGRVLDEKYFPVVDITISISNGGTTRTSSDGSFSIYTEKLPCDLILTDISNNTAVLYRGLSITDPELTLFGDYPPRNVNSEAVKIEFPPIPREHSAIIKFISSDLFYSEQAMAFTGEKSKVLTVSWSQNVSSIGGKIIYLEKTSTSYDRFEERAYTVIKDFYPQIVKFDSSTSFTTPGESFLTINMPTVTYTTGGFKVSADFLSLNRNSEITLNTTEGEVLFSKCLVPLSVPYGFRLKVIGYAYSGDGSGFSSIFYTYPNAVYNIQTETPPKLTAPQDKFWGVSNSTEFGYEWGSGSGVYVINFHSLNPVGDVYVVTKEKFISSPFNYASNILTGEDFSWKVYKYLTYITTDEFVRKKQFNNDIGYKAFLQSETRTFRKKPY
jgi:hypothetical protein